MLFSSFYWLPALPWCFLHPMQKRHQLKPVLSASPSIRFFLLSLIGLSGKMGDKIGLSKTETTDERSHFLCGPEVPYKIILIWAWNVCFRCSQQGGKVRGSWLRLIVIDAIDAVGPNGKVFWLLIKPEIIPSNYRPQYLILEKLFLFG